MSCKRWLSVLLQILCVLMFKCKPCCQIQNNCKLPNIEVLSWLYGPVTVQKHVVFCKHTAATSKVKEHEPYLWPPAGACLHDKLQSCGGSIQWMHVDNECMNSVNNIVHRILLHCQQKGWANGFLPKYLFCNALAAGYQTLLPSEASHSSGKLTPWNQSLCPLQYSPMMQWHSYTTGAPLVVPKPTPFVQ